MQCSSLEHAIVKTEVKEEMKMDGCTPELEDVNLLPSVKKEDFKEEKPYPEDLISYSDRLVSLKVEDGLSFLPKKEGLKEEHPLCSGQVEEICSQFKGENIDQLSFSAYDSQLGINFNSEEPFQGDQSSNEKPHVCDVCQRTFKRTCSLETHKRTHSGMNPYTCEEDLAQDSEEAVIAEGRATLQSQKKSTTSKGLQIQQRGQTGKKGPISDVCTNLLTTLPDLNKHMTCHPGERHFCCKMCYKSFPEKGKLVRHMRSHGAKKPFVCEVCKKSFARSEDLPIHMRTHTREKPYTCKVCKKKYTTSSILAVHMRIHTGEKRFICEVCSKSFTRSGTLEHHMRGHSGEKPYSCKVCNKSFTRSDVLLKHMRIHTGEKPYTCEVCQKLFARADVLASHMKKDHTGEKPQKS